MSPPRSARVFATWALTIWASILAPAPASLALPGFCFWDGGGGADNLWTNPANWDVAAPGPSDFAIFDLGPDASYAVHFPGNNVLLPPQNHVAGAVHLGSNTVSFLRRTNLFSTLTLNHIATDESTRALVVGQNADDRATLTSAIPIYAPSAIIADHAGSQGTLNLTANLTLSGKGIDPRDLIVGNHGHANLEVRTGTLRLTRPGAVISIGRHPESNARLAVSGPNAMLVLPSVTSQILVGENPLAATFTVNGGARAFVGGSITVGRASGTSLLHIGDPGTTLTAGSITVGEAAAGEVFVSNGAHLITGAASLARHGGSKALVHLHGNQSRWTVNGNIKLGETLFGPMPVTNITISPGATLSVAGDIVSTFGFDTLDLRGGTLDLQNHSISGGLITSFESGTLRNLGQFNLGGIVSKVTPGTLVIEGENTYTGPTHVTAGTLRVTGSIAQSRRVDVFDAAFEVASTQSLKYLHLNDSATAMIMPGFDKVLTTGGLTMAGAPGNWNAQLDIADNAMIVQTDGGTHRAATYARIFDQVKSGLAEATGQFWTGNGITSATAAADSGGINTAVGLILNDFAAIGLPPGPIYDTFLGQPVTPNDILLRYTFVGDADLSGVVDGTDYFMVDQAFVNGTVNGGWISGDFNYDGKVDGTDYFLIDTVYSSLGASPSATPVSPLPEPSCVLALLLAATAIHRRRR